MNPKIYFCKHDVINQINTKLGKSEKSYISLSVYEKLRKIT